MANTVTVTGSTGPGVDVTAQVYNNVTFFSVDPVNKVLDIIYDNGDGQRRIQIDISAAVTFTVTISGGEYTVEVEET